MIRVVQRGLGPSKVDDVNGLCMKVVHQMYKELYDPSVTARPGCVLNINGLW